MNLSDLQLDDGEQRIVEISGVEVLLCRSGGQTFAVGTHCPHQGASLLGGRVRGRTISCPLHGARFDLTNGRSLGAQYPPLVVYDLEERDGQLVVSQSNQPG